MHFCNYGIAGVLWMIVIFVVSFLKRIGDFCAMCCKLFSFFRQITPFLIAESVVCYVWQDMLYFIAYLRPPDTTKERI